jgi:hypothetical protein
MRWALRLVLVAVVLLSGCGAGTRVPPASDRASNPQTPPPGSQDEPSAIDPDADAAPDITVTTFDGDRFSLTDHRGMPVVINFFDSW